MRIGVLTADAASTRTDPRPVVAQPQLTLAVSNMDAAVASLQGVLGWREIARGPLDATALRALGRDPARQLLEVQVGDPRNRALRARLIGSVGDAGATPLAVPVPVPATSATGLLLELPVADVARAMDRAMASGATLTSELQILRSAGLGTVKRVGLRLPGIETPLALIEPNVRPLSGREMKALLSPGVRGSWTNFAGGPGGTMRYEADGSAEVRWSTGQATGHWLLRDDALCTAWTTLRNGRELCARYYWLSGRRYQSFRVDGTPDGFNEFE